MTPTKIEKLYIACVVLAMGLLFYANAEDQWTPDGVKIQLGIGKAFYGPCAVALLASLRIKRGYDKFDKIINALVVIGLISSFLHPPLNPNVMSWMIVRFLFGIYCFRAVRYVDTATLIKYFAIASPIIVLPHYIVSNPFAWGAMRYGGLYGDPNYLAMSLNFLNVLCYLYIKDGSSKLIKIGASVSILATIPLIMLGMSRGGLIGLGATLFFILRDVKKVSKTYYYTLLIAGALASTPFLSRMADTVENIATRFSSDSETDVRSSELRIEGIESGFRVLGNLPYLIPFGIGVGNTEETMEQYKPYGYTTYVIIHSTPFAVLYEFGIFGFIVYLYLLYWVARQLYRNKLWLFLGLLGAASLNILTLQAIAFMPFWIMMFFLSKYEFVYKK